MNTCQGLEERGTIRQGFLEAVVPELYLEGRNHKHLLTVRHHARPFKLIYCHDNTVRQMALFYSGRKPQRD